MNLKSFLIRTVSGIAILALLIFAFAMGGIFLTVFMGIVSLIGVYEIHCACTGNKTQNVMNYTTYLSTIALYILPIAIKDEKLYLGMLIVISVAVLLLIGEYVLKYPSFEFFDIARSVFVIVYIPMMLLFICLTRNLEMGKYLIWLIVIGSWGCDTCAYLSGSAFGKHKLAPVLSPKKSVEGAVGGVIGSALIAFIYALSIVEIFSIGQGILISFPVIAAFAAVFSQIGDLCASAIKRQYKIKDYGNLIPGHGGVLDRFDSMIITAPVIFILGVIFG